jgi:hypothetical protein
LYCCLRRDLGQIDANFPVAKVISEDGFEAFDRVVKVFTLVSRYSNGVVDDAYLKVYGTAVCLSVPPLAANQAEQVAASPSITSIASAHHEIIVAARL